MRTTSTSACASAANSGTPAPPAHGAEPQQAPATARSRRKRAAGRRARAGRAARRCRTSISRPNTKADADAHAARLVHAPEHEHQRHEVGHPGAGRGQRQEIEEQRDAANEADERRLEPAAAVLGLAACVISASLPSARPRRAFSARRSLLDCASAGRGGRAVSSASTST